MLNIFNLAKQNKTNGLSSDIIALDRKRKSRSE